MKSLLRVTNMSLDWKKNYLAFIGLEKACNTWSHLISNDHELWMILDHAHTKKWQ